MWYFILAFLLYVIVNVLYFKHRAEFYELEIPVAQRTIRQTIDNNWTDFRTKASLTEVTGKNVKNLWIDIVKANYINSFNQIATLRLTISGIYKYPQSLVEAWMVGYRRDYLHDMDKLNKLVVEYRELLSKPRYKLINKFFKYPRVGGLI